ncbi:similar to MARVEL (membrane-associating) domain containing 3 isoform a (predicted), isoform CRA_a [Rattus norvegicus]|uniref:MARVEL domain containing 3 n=2 Tax=Rattus norvegicus TaxID=10116 RepID=D4A1D5_RAT|nr:MARVEL domain-containing protein 3 [Rattus norvegicus]EDL92517.1 similar to MARVEL (membrane-associating) domain containing 3 isoform a (predicted), isoform CRA_a [Rattus norvegicus]|eukprot:NP_001102602.1 MARVEL domain-containing protein 3 [Rattus norvegicus]
MKNTSGTREPRTRPRERDPDRRPHRDRDRHVERPRDPGGDRHRERNGDVRGNGDRRAGREHRTDREPRQDRHRDAGHRAAEQRAREKSRQSRARPEPWGPSWDTAGTPGPAPWRGPEPPLKHGLGRRGLESELASERYISTYSEPARQEEEYYQSEAEGILECHKCRYLCTGRGVVQIMEVILNGMVLMCIVASYFVLAGFSASFASGSGFGNNYYSPFEGTELEQVRQLDQQYTILRSPLIYSGVAVSLGLGVLTMGVLLQGAKSLRKLPGRWLLLEAAFSLLAAVGYCVGIGFYLYVALRINSTDTCKTRERVYARKGLTWMNCQLAGTDGAAATFACLLVILYIASVVLALRAYREQQHYKDSQKQHRNYRDVPEYLWSETL